MERSGLHPKLSKCIDEMMSDMTLLLYYYGEFCQFVLFQETENVPRCAVNVLSGGMVFYWNRKFLDITPQKHINFIIVHEIFHLILDHPKRIRHGGFEMKLSNIATDMIINTAIKSDFIDVDSPTKTFIEVPTEKVKKFDSKGKIIEDDHVWVIFVPDEYKGEHIYENVYDWLKEEKKKFDKWKKDKNSTNFDGDWTPPEFGDGDVGDDIFDQENGEGNPTGDPSDFDKDGDKDSDGENGKGNKPTDKNSKDGKGNNKDGKGSGDSKDESDGNGNGEIQPSKNNGKKSDDCPVSDYLKNIFEGMDGGLEEFLDSHLSSDIPDEIRRNIVDEVKEHLRQRGFEKSKIQKTLEKLVKSKKDYLREIKTSISSLRGYNKVKSITKRNRRSIPGIKGRRKEGFGLNVILDLSGSMTGYHQKALTYIFQNNIIINLIQCDNQIQMQNGKSYFPIKNKREFKKIQLVGFGGTELQPGIDLIADTKELRGLNTLIITDGATDRLDVSRLKKTLILTVDKPCPILAGVARQIVVDDNEEPDPDW